jgi:mono/diheme cytochrome c family protein
MSLRVMCSIVVLAVGVVVAPERSSGEEKPDAAAILYTRYCASCHGTSGRGDGPVAGELTKRPTDLTTLTSDVPALMKSIDGRRTIRAHGTSAMPVWGYVFEESLVGEPHRLRTVLHELRLLAEYCRDLQQRP